ncbi:myeloid-associated differentiation marker homolog [Nelusetta ayraudi]|uniref:myeloid-associated differentiation marker homolog n=1 Tax=Nelusetta ayraudi TaxID=303726 RepID=UPI003F714A91
MTLVNFRTLIQPMGIIRILAVVLTCSTFSLASTYILRNALTYWAWCMFTWIFCFVVTFLILVVELIGVNTKVPTWDDLSAGFAILQGLMCLSAAMIYSIISTDETDNRLIAATVLSWPAFVLYVAEVVLTQLRPSGETSGFFSTIAGIMKIVEMVLACLILTSLDDEHYGRPEVGWCVAVYSLCFIFALLIVVFTLTRLTARLPFSFDKLMVGYNALAAVMYITAMVLWPLSTCEATGCEYKQVAVTTLTVLNCVVYILDTAYSIFIVFFDS